MPKGKSPFRVLQGEGDTLKKEIDAFMEECGLVLDDSSLKDRTPRMKKLFERCGALRKKCKALDKKLTNLSKGKEPTVIPNFDEMRSEEVDRMHVLEVRLKKIGNKLEPDEVEESYFNNVKDTDESMKEQGSKSPTGEFDDDSNDDDDDDDEEDEEIDDEEKEESKMETTNPDEENEGDVDKEGDGKKTKFKRRSMFRRSKTDTKVEKVEDEAEKEKKDKKDKDKKEKKDKDKKGKEKSEKEKEKEKEKERKEQEKKEKKEKEKLEKEKKEKEKKEQKEKEQEEKRKKKEEKELAAKLAKSKKGEDGDTKKDKDEDKRPDSPSKRGFGAKLFSRDSKKPKIEESKKEQSGTIEDESEDEEDAEDGIDNEEGEGSEEDMEEEEDGGREEEEEEDEEEELEDVEEEEEEEEEQQQEKRKKVEPKQDKKKGWSFLRRDKSPQRKVKKDNDKDDKKKKKEDKKQVRVQEEEEEEEDEEEEEVDEEEEYEDEEEEDEEEEEEESDDEQVVMKGKKPQRVESEEEEEEGSEEEEEEEEGEEEELEDEEESEEELLEGESDEEEEEENFKPPDEGMDLFEAVCDFEGEEDDDLYFKRGAILTILNVREDGWWMAEDEEGNKGLVPSTYLKLKKEHNDYRDVQSPEVDEAAESVSPRSGKELWRGLRKSVTETGVTDVLTAMGAIPAGFRPSTTAKHLRLDAYTLCNFLKPRFTESCLGFQDLNWSPHENQIRAKTVRLQKILTLIMVRNMPACGVGIEIKSRHVRICFFDGDKILSNIHTIQATWNKNDPKTWRFSPKVTSLLPSILDGDCFIRSSRTEENTGLLLELCLSYVRPKTGEKGELSCGWVNVPLYDTATGAPIVNKMYEFQVQGGTPFEQEVEVDPSISRRTSSSKFRSMMSANKQPRIQIKFITPTKEQKPLLDTLPETIVSSLGYLPFLSIFRNLQAVEVLRDRIDLQNADLIHCPVLANFPEATKYPDIMDALRSCWADKKLKNKKIDKKDPEQMKELFTSTFMDSVYPIMRLPSLPPYKWADEERDSERWQVISEFLQSNKQKGILASFLAPGGEHSPFDMTEVAFNLLDSFQELK